MRPELPIFHPYQFGPTEQEQLNMAGHLILPGLLTCDACQRLTTALEHIAALGTQDNEKPHRYAAEYDTYLASLIAHPQMLELAQHVLGPDIRFDHCVSLNRPPKDQGIQWHSHAYADDRPELGFVRIFFYINGFAANDGGLKVVPGSYLWRDSKLRAASDDELRIGWLAGKQHPYTGQALEIECLDAPPGTVVLMWTHAAHAVTPRQSQSQTRWAVVYAYRNPGEPSHARWITEEFEQAPPPDAKPFISLY